MHGVYYNLYDPEVSEGQCLGEWSLVNRKPRAESVVCFTECDFVVLSYETYQRTVGATRMNSLHRTKALNILRSKDSSKRTAEDNSIIEKVLERNDFFLQIDPRMRFEICKRMRYVRLEPGDILFSQGDDADAFFVILAGNVGVYLDKNDGGEAMHIAVLAEGGSFGERALDMDSTRTATIRAIGVCELAKVARADYKRVVMSHRVDAIRRERLIEILKNKESRTAQDLSLLLDVVRSNKLFSTLTEFAQKEICRNMTYSFVKRDRLLLKEGDPSNHYYMILRGCVGVLEGGGCERGLSSDSHSVMPYNVRPALPLCVFSW